MKKRQHIVPVGYLKQFTYDENQKFVNIYVT